MTRAEKINTSIHFAVAFGTILLAVVAIWGDWFRDAFAGPDLQLSLRSSSGFLTKRPDPKAQIMFYHIQVTNRHSWSTARRVRILVTQFDKKRADNNFTPEPLIARPQLTWAPADSHEQFATINKSDTCDLGFVGEKSDVFALSVYHHIPGFLGYIKAGEAMRVYVIASADNFESKKPLVIEIAWDGKWSDKKDEMQQHLIIKEVQVP